jgi:outer membrane protein assembly factor BamA
MRSIFLGLILSCSSIASAVGIDTTSSRKVWIKSIIIQGNDKTKDYVILREMSTKIGDSLSQESLLQDQNRIYSLRLFNRVAVTSDTAGDSATVFVDVNERWYWFPYPILGFRFRDISKLYYGVGFTHQNFRGRNEKLYVSFALGYDRWVSFHYQNPKLTDNDDIFFGFDGSYGRSPNLSVQTSSYDQYYYDANISLGKRFGLYQTILGTVGYDIQQVSDPSVGRTLSTSGRDAYAYSSLNYTYDSRNIAEYATEGTYVGIGFNKSGFGESQVNLATYAFDLRQFLPINDDWSVGVRTFGNFTEGGLIPIYRHVYYGYGERLRGYFHDILEGEDIMGGNLEFRIAILKPRYLKLSFIPVPEFSVLRYGLYAGIFADGGKIWYRSQSFPGGNWLSGYGAGLHFLLPYSLVVRTEYAFNNVGRGQLFVDLEASF